MAAAAAAVDALQRNLEDLVLPRRVCELSQLPDALTFLRDHVARNTPFIVRGGCAHWPAVTRWTPAYLRSLVGQLTVSVEATPNGRADAVTTAPDGQSAFVLPETQRWQFADFLDLVEARTTNTHLTESAQREGVFYVSHQNGSLTAEDEFGGALNADIELEHAFARTALGEGPDAINFWMGLSDAVTSLHKDHYENIYSVVRGTKTFTLLPPSDAPFLQEVMLPTWQYGQKPSGEFEMSRVEGEGATRPWLLNDPMQPDLTRFPLYAQTHPLTVEVHAGDVLYLPSLWYHHVAQEGDPCIAVNTWYDMSYGLHYCYHSFLEQLTSDSAVQAALADTPQTETAAGHER